MPASSFCSFHPPILHVDLCHWQWLWLSCSQSGLHAIGIGTVSPLWSKCCWSEMSRDCVSWKKSKSTYSPCSDSDKFFFYTNDILECYLVLCCASCFCLLSPSVSLAYLHDVTPRLRSACVNTTWRSHSSEQVHFMDASRFLNGKCESVP